MLFNTYWSLVKSDDSGLKRLSPHKQEPISWQTEHLVLPPDTMLLSRKTLMNAYITSILVQLTPDKTTHCIAHLTSPKPPKHLKINLKDDFIHVLSLLSVSDYRNCGEMECLPLKLLVIIEVVLYCGTVSIWLWLLCWLIDETLYMCGVE